MTQPRKYTYERAAILALELRQRHATIREIKCLLERNKCPTSRGKSRWWYHDIEQACGTDAPRYLRAKQRKSKG